MSASATLNATMWERSRREAGRIMAPEPGLSGGGSLMGVSAGVRIHPVGVKAFKLFDADRALPLARHRHGRGTARGAEHGPGDDVGRHRSASRPERCSSSTAPVVDQTTRDPRAHQSGSRREPLLPVRQGMGADASCSSPLRSGSGARTPPRAIEALVDEDRGSPATPGRRPRAGHGKDRARGSRHGSCSGRSSTRPGAEELGGTIEREVVGLVRRCSSDGERLRPVAAG